jgi:hypothetical protein
MLWFIIPLLGNNRRISKHAIGRHIDLAQMSRFHLQMEGKIQSPKCTVLNKNRIMDV